MTFPGTEDTTAKLPADVEVRVGIAEVGGLGLQVRVSGALISCGFLDTTVTANSPVALLRFGGRWLCLGNIQTQP